MNVMRNVTREDTIVVITKVTAMGAPIPELPLTAHGTRARIVVYDSIFEPF